MPTKIPCERWWYEQLTPSGVSPNHYVVVFKPEAIIPQPEIR